MHIILAAVEKKVGNQKIGQNVIVIIWSKCHCQNVIGQND